MGNAGTKQGDVRIWCGGWFACGQTDVAAPTDRTTWRQRLFREYVARMLERERKLDSLVRYPPEAVEHYLTWLAGQMRAHGLVELYLERLQPDWLPDVRARRRYQRACGLAGVLLYGLSGGLSGGLSVGLQFGDRYGLSAGLNHVILRWVSRRAGLVPLHLVRFLNYAADHVLLQQVGGSYRFVHVLLRDYFADAGAQGPGIEGKV